MINVLVPIADGSEEMEAVILIDMLRRADITVTVASVKPGDRIITASRQVKITADTTIDTCMNDQWDMIALPGGMPGAENLGECTELMQLITRQMNADKWVAAICASPAVVLGTHNLITGYKATCYPGFVDQLQGKVSEVLEDKVVVDKNLITSRGPGTAFDFSLAIIRALQGDKAASDTAEAALIG